MVFKFDQDTKMELGTAEFLEIFITEKILTIALVSKKFSF